MSMQHVLVTPARPYRRLTPTIWQCMGRAIGRALESLVQRRTTRQLLAEAARAERHDPALAHRLRIASHFDTLT